MDVEDEPNSYLKYLNDSETPNAYLLETNGLFPVEPIFTEMATDWPQESFPLLLTNPLINEEECNNANTLANELTSSKTTSVSKNIQGSDGLQQAIEECLPESNIDNPNVIAASLQSNKCAEVRQELALNKYDNVQSIHESQNEITQEMSLQTNDHGQENNNAFGSPSNNNIPYRIEGTVATAENNALTTPKTLVTQKRYIIIKPSVYPIVKKSKSQVTVNKGKSVIADNTLTGSLNLAKGQNQLISQGKMRKNIDDLFVKVVANKCRICSFLCEDANEIKKHIGKSHPQRVNGLPEGISILLPNGVNKSQQASEKPNKEYTLFVCSECRAVCIDKDGLKNHMIQVHGLATETEIKNKEVGEIPLKNKTTAYIDDKNIRHVKQQERALQRVKCTVEGCNHAFPSEEVRKKHEKLHVENTRSTYKCSECDQFFGLWRITRRHLFSEHGLDFGMIKCPMCNNFKSYIPAAVMRHMMIHSVEKPYLCAECGKSFRQQAQLKNHEVVHKVPEDVPTWATAKKCDQCQRFFANAKSLKNHVKCVHENIRPFICNICGHKTSRKSMLVLHMRQHTASKPFKCERCDFRTGDPNSIRKHTMKHLGIVSYQCPHCPYKCIQSSSIKSHITRKHKNKGDGLIYKCSQCSFTTINGDILKAHEKTHQSVSKEPTGVDANLATMNIIIDKNLQAEEQNQSCFLNTDSQLEETVDNGGITIPADTSDNLDLTVGRQL